MDNEGFGTQLELDITPFEQAINKAKAVWNGLSKVLSTGANNSWLKSVDEQAKKAGSELDALKIRVEALKKLADNKGAFSFGGGVSEDFYLVGDALEQMIGYLQDAEANLHTVNEEAENTANDVRDIGNASEDAKEKASGLPDIFKKMGMAVIGVRSAFSFFRKVVSTALSNNIELSNKFNAIWQALGNAITPILERIANAILTVFSYLNIFVKTLSGGKIDLLAKTSKSATSTAGSLKEASKYLAGFDELQNVDDGSSGGGGGSGIGSVGNPFADVELKPEIIELIEGFGNFVKDHFPEIILLIGGFFLAFKTGSTLLESCGVGLLLAGIYEIFKGLYDIFEGSFTGDLEQVSKGFAELAGGIGLVSVVIGAITGNWNSLYGLIIAGVALLVSWVVKHWDEIKQAFIDIVDAMVYQWEGFKKTISNLIQALKDWIIEKWGQIKEGWTTMVENIKTKWNNFKTDVVNKVQEIKQKISDKWTEIKTNFSTMVENIKTKWNEFKTNMVQKVEDIKTSLKGKINAIIGFFEGMANAGVRAVNKVIAGLNKISFSIPSWVPSIGGKSFGFNLKQIGEVTLARLDTGTNYVPNDQLAMIHKGEAVIPKKFNSEEYFNNAETAEKLDKVIDLLENIDFAPYITVKDIGTTATKYQQQQVRIMGGKL